MTALAVDRLPPENVDQPRVRGLLRLDSIVCAGSGAIAILGAGPVADLLDVDEAWVLGVGLFLVAYAVTLWLLARARSTVARPAAAATVVGDGLWVVASLALVATDSFSTAGDAVVLGMAAAVAALGSAKVVALRATQARS